MLRAVLIAIAVTIAAGMAHAVTVPEIIERVRAHLWPQRVQPVPMPAAKPKPQRSIEHRKVHRPGPRIVKREVAPLPRVRAPAAITRPEKRERPAVKKQRTAAAARLPSCAHVKREYDKRTEIQRGAAYLSLLRKGMHAEIAHGRACLGL